MRSNFLGGAYAVRSLPLAAQTCINLFAENNEGGGNDIGAFYGTPGLRKVAHRHYLVIYRVDEAAQRVEIVRVWDGRQDPQTLRLQ